MQRQRREGRYLHSLLLPLVLGRHDRDSAREVRHGCLERCVIDRAGWDRHGTRSLLQTFCRARRTERWLRLLAASLPAASLMADGGCAGELPSEKLLSAISNAAIRRSQQEVSHAPNAH